MSDITKQEAVEMMRRCAAEIVGLRREVEHLRPLAEAYENIAKLLSLLPDTSRRAMSEDIVWQLNRRIEELVHNDNP